MQQFSQIATFITNCDSTKIKEVFSVSDLRKSKWLKKLRQRLVHQMLIELSPSDSVTD